MRTRRFATVLVLFLAASALVVARDRLAVPIEERPSATPIARQALPSDSPLRALDCTTPVALPEKIDRLLRVLDIYDERYQTISAYSKGMRQKILIAAAVLHNPRLVVFDEPFSGLDVSAARALKVFVRGLTDLGKMVVFSSHVLEVVEQVCSRVVILNEGRVIGHDSVERLRVLMQLPSLDAVFATLVVEQNADDRSKEMLDIMRV